MSSTKCQSPFPFVSFSKVSTRSFRLCNISMFNISHVQAGQFIGARPDFVPEPICQHLRKLQDDVPPMPEEEVEAALKRELRISSLGDVFEWIDLEKPLGSASIAQVHKAKLRRYVAAPSTTFNILTFPVRICRALFGAFCPALACMCMVLNFLPSGGKPDLCKMAAMSM